jgi:hypothetical protein
MRVMLQGRAVRSEAFAAVAVATALLALSCGGGGGAETSSVVGSSPAQSTAVANDSGVVTASGQPKQDVCHYAGGSYQTLNLPPPAVSAHLAQHSRDYAGACRTSATCPCFTKAMIESLAATCSVGLVAQCDVTHSLQLYCSPGPFSSNLGYFEAATSSCVSITQDEVTGDLVRRERAVSASELQACKDAITTSGPYLSTDPGICPR